MNIDDLLGDLGGTSSAERAKLVEWLLEQGASPSTRFGATNLPLLLATPPPSATHLPEPAREIMRIHGVGPATRGSAVGLARVDDPICMRADGEARHRAQRPVEGLNPTAVLVVRGSPEGVTTAEAMRYTAGGHYAPGLPSWTSQRGRMVSQTVPLLGR